MSDGGGVSVLLCVSREEKMERSRLGDMEEEEGKWAAMGICNEVSRMLMWLWPN